jgi:hypothetical protein
MIMEQSGVVLAIHLQPGRGDPPRSTGEARALVGRGLDGDYHAKARPSSDRQVLLVDRRVLESLGYVHGALREQLTVDFEGLDTILEGARLRVGEVDLEVAGPCEPCNNIGQLIGVPDPEALRRTLTGRRGVLARVVGITGGGRIRLGDALTLLTGGGGKTR